MHTTPLTSFALQIAKASGATVIATTSSEEKAASLRKLGADHVVNYRRNESWEDEVVNLVRFGRLKRGCMTCM